MLKQSYIYMTEEAGRRNTECKVLCKKFAHKIENKIEFLGKLFENGTALTATYYKNKSKLNMYGKIVHKVWVFRTTGTSKGRHLPHLITDFHLDIDKIFNKLNEGRNVAVYIGHTMNIYHRPVRGCMFVSGKGMISCPNNKLSLMKRICETADNATGEYVYEDMDVGIRYEIC